MSQIDSTLVPQPDVDEAAFLEQYDQAHQMNVDTAAEVRISRLALLQSKSPEIEDKKEGYETGMYVNNFTREILTLRGKAPWLIEAGVPENEVKSVDYVTFIPIIKLPTEFIKWRPRKERQPGEKPYEFKSLDQSDPRVRAGVWPKRGGTWGTKEGQEGAPPVTDNINYLVLPFNYIERTPVGNFMVLTFARTSAQCGVTLTTQLDTIATVNRLRPFQTIFFLYAKNEPRGENKVQVMHVAKSKYTAKEYVPELYKLAIGMAAAVTDKAQGYARQCDILNVADVAEDDQHATQEGEVVEGKASNGGASDPFPEI